MSQRIIVSQEEKIANGWRFRVIVGEGESAAFSVTLSMEYWQKLTGKDIAPDELIRKSFEFLLKREPAGSILSEFNLQDINRYFPEYESIILSDVK